MPTLTAHAVTIAFGATEVLHGVDVTIGDGDRVGLVGPNGAGKSTLLRVLAAELAPDSGSVTATGTVGFLPQEADRRTGETLLGYLGRRTGVHAAEAAMHAAAEGLGSESAAAAQQYDAALQHWLDLGGADFDARAAQTLNDLGLDAAALDADTTGLSGGQMARGSLAAVLLSRYDLLLLDEPTNDLDLDGLERLEGFVLSRRGGLAVVSHDREFLARTITGVLDLDPYNKVSRQFAGGWEAYLAERAVARQHAREQYDDFADKRAELSGRMQAAREQSVRGALRARRKAPDNDKSVRSGRIEAATSGASKVRSLETRLARLDTEAVVEPRKEWQLRLELPAAPRSGDLVATLSQAVVQRGHFTLGPVDLDVRWADRLSIVGANGGGKTTLLQALLGRLPLSSGTASLGPGVIAGELDQARSAFASTSTDERTVVEIVCASSGLLPDEGRTLLAKFGLKAGHVERGAASLSPGERTRAGLALLMANQTNCLVLDEPTNHLDVRAIDQLEQALADYSGTLVVVSHDRAFVEAVGIDRVLELAR